MEDEFPFGGEVANCDGLSTILGFQGSEKEGQKSLEGLVSDWNIMINSYSQQAPEHIGVEKVNLKEMFEVKEPDFKKGKLGESAARKQSGPITVLKPFPQSQKAHWEMVAASGQKWKSPERRKPARRSSKWRWAV